MICRPTRRRGEELEQAIFKAVLEGLHAVGYAGLTMERVAAEARTGKAALYRRWAGKEDLVIDALHHLFPPVAEPPDTGSVRDDLCELLMQMRQVLNSPAGPAIHGLLGDPHRDGGLVRAVQARVLEPRRRLLLGALRSGAERGEVRQEAACELVAGVGPAMLVHHILTVGPPVSRRTVERIVDDVLVPILRSPDGQPACTCSVRPTSSSMPRSVS